MNRDTAFTNQYKSQNVEISKQLQSIPTSSEIRFDLINTRLFEVLSTPVCIKIELLFIKLTPMMVTMSNNQLQFVQNQVSAASILARHKRSDHIRLLLNSLHGFPVRFKILLLTSNALHGLGSW